MENMEREDGYVKRRKLARNARMVTYLEKECRTVKSWEAKKDGFSEDVRCARM